MKTPWLATDGYPEISRRNRSFRGLADTEAFIGEAGSIPAEIAPQPGDVQVVKKRVSAFSGSDLELVLRSQTVDSLVLCGIATSGVVLSTLRQAADLDYELTVLRDCCLDGDSEVHRVLCEKVFPRQADGSMPSAGKSSLDGEAGAATGPPEFTLVWPSRRRGAPRSCPPDGQALSVAGAPGRWASEPAPWHASRQR